MTRTESGKPSCCSHPPSKMCMAPISDSTDFGQQLALKGKLLKAELNHPWTISHSPTLPYFHERGESHIIFRGIHHFFLHESDKRIS